MLGLFQLVVWGPIEKRFLNYQLVTLVVTCCSETKMEVFFRKGQSPMRRSRKTRIQSHPLIDAFHVFRAMLLAALSIFFIALFLAQKAETHSSEVEKHQLIPTSLTSK